MTPSPQCPRCGAALPAGAPDGLCPACLMSKALPSNFDTVKLAAPPWSKGSNVRYVGDYELLEEIATGGMGVVWKARQTKLDRVVAVKMVRGGALAGSDDVQRFHAEAQAAANLKHPNIVGIHEVGEHEGQHYYSMDHIEGRTLADQCHGSAMSPREAARLLQTICDAVHYAHQRGVLHRDLKPHNLMLDAEGSPHVLDFGLAKRLDGDLDLTMSGAVLGSPSYMAPEQAQGRNDRVGPHTDVYALGAILFQMLTGRAPFLADSMAETMMQVVQREPVPPSKFNPDLPRDLETICLKCLEKEPARRYATARELGDDLTRFLKGDPILAKPAGLVRTTGVWLRRHPGWLAGALALFVLGLLCTVFWLYQENTFLHAQQLDPGLKRAPGNLSRNLREWFGLSALIVMNLGAWTNLWFIKHSRRTTWLGVFEHMKHRTASPVPAHVRIVQTLGGLFCAGYGLFLIAKLIEAYVWEGGGAVPGNQTIVPSGYLLVAFVIVWIGFWMLLMSWWDYLHHLQGPPDRKLNDATRAAICQSVERGDIVGATQLYRHAVPEAGRREASEYVAQRVAELRTADSAGYEKIYAQQWRRTQVRFVVAVFVIAAALGLVFGWKASQRLQVAWYLFGGILLGTVGILAAQTSGFAKRVLPVLVGIPAVIAGGTLIFDKPLQGELWFMCAGVAAAVAALRIGRGSRPPAKG